MASLQRENFDGSPDSVSEDVLERHRKTAASLLRDEPYKLLIDGNWVDTQGGTTEEAVDTITGESLTKYQRASKKDVDRAVESAKEAYDSEWGELSGSERAVYLDEIADRLEESASELVQLDGLETGLETVQAPFVQNMITDQFRYFAALARTADQGSLPEITHNMGEVDPNTGEHVYTVKEPYGPVGLISGWNFATTYIGFKFAPALAAGNTIVFKPSLRAVLSGLEASKIFDDVLPDGVVNTVPGGPDVGQAITSHKRLRKVSLTGSVDAGREAMKGAAANIKSVHLELGGKSPLIAFPDADIEGAVQHLLQNIFAGAGQGCTHRSRLFVHEDIAEEFLASLEAMTEAMFNPGDPLDAETTLAPLVDHKHLDRVKSFVETAKSEGAEVFLGGDQLEVDGLGDAPFFEPTVLTNVDNDDTVACEEVFGPVLSVIEWNDRDEVIEQANDTDFGLAASMFTEDLSTAHTVAREIEAGIISVNGGTTGGGGGFHGGYKQSGLGSEFGKEAYHDYRQTKIIGIDLS